MLELLFGSRVRVKVLGIILEKDGLHLRQIARQADVSPSEAKRELDKFCRLGIIKKEEKGGLAIFTRNRDCPFLSDLKMLYGKTEGYAEQLKSALKGIKGVKYAFIFGSTAAGREREKSDVDLMIIGDVSMGEIEEKMLAVQKNVGREINFFVWSQKDLETKAAQKSRFLGNIVKNRRLWLIGDEDEFVRIAQKRHDRKDRA